MPAFAVPVVRIAFSQRRDARLEFLKDKCAGTDAFVKVFIFSGNGEMHGAQQPDEFNVRRGQFNRDFMVAGGFN
ncbi:hypothetical protein SRABI106_01720 [Rahnella aquatilis]|nr:hypothetical protein SRABI106_01720 [Rahnella aquatilis]